MRGIIPARFPVEHIGEAIIERSRVYKATLVHGDPDPDLIEGIEMHWGINEMEVRE